MSRIDRQRVYITGGSSGIGLATARQMAAMGADVALFARNVQRLDRARAEVETAAARSEQSIFSLPMDVTDPEDVRKKCNLARVQFGEPDILITSAGVPMAGRFEDIGANRFDSVVQTNLYGTRHVIAALLPAMLAKGNGHIIPIASIAGLFGVYGYSAYSATKFALVGLAECLRSELINHNIRVSVFCPPEVDTPILAAEKADLPPVTRILKNMAGTLSAESAARALVRGIAKNHFMIVPGLRAKVFCWLKRLMPNWVFWGLPDFIVKRRGH